MGVSTKKGEFSLGYELMHGLKYMHYVVFLHII